MTWSQIGWVIIALGAVLLVVFNFLFKKRFRYPVRAKSSVQAFLDQRVRAVERGETRQVLLGDQFWSRAYPALGLHALSVFAGLLRVDKNMDEGQLVGTGTGELALFARQIIQGSYQNGVSTHLSITLPGPTPPSFTAGVLMEMGFHPPASLGLFGNYGHMGALLTETAMMKGAHVFAAAGSITAQAALFFNLRDLLIGEEVFLLPGLLDQTPGNQAGWAAEDVLRVLLMALLVIVAGLKMAGVL
jgi:hypothetical protein